MLIRIRTWLVAHPNWTLTLLVFAALAPFLTKPFNIDDPLFILAAKQIQAHPANPYGFDVNWYDSARPMWSVMQNPPLASGFIALVATLLGWGETGLHLGFMFPAIAAILGTYRLAKFFCRQPMLSALVTLFTPVFLVSATTVMCDVLLLAFWIWAVVFWVEGLAKNESRRLFISGLIMGLAVLSKYYGFCLVPLLAVYALMHRGGNLRHWILALLIPVLTLVAYECSTLVLYGHALFSSAAGYATFVKSTNGFSMILLALGFAGGCFATAIFYAPLLWKPRTLLAFAAIASVLMLVLGKSLLNGYDSLDTAGRSSLEIQIILWTVGGISVLALAVTDFWRQRDAGALLLLLWVLGTFIFAGFLNWTINGRSLLPAMPAIAILVVRRLDQKKWISNQTGWIVLAGAVLALLVTRADYLLAHVARQSAEQTYARHGRETSTLWFQGHWGYQYYLEALGASPVDMTSSPLKPGDLLALPRNNTNVRGPKPEFVDLVDTLVIPKGKWLATVDVSLGAGFYNSSAGPLPFVFGEPTTEGVQVLRLKNLAPNATNSPAQ